MIFRSPAFTLLFNLLAIPFSIGYLIWAADSLLGWITGAYIVLLTGTLIAGLAAYAKDASDAKVEEPA